MCSHLRSKVAHRVAWLGFLRYCLRRMKRVYLDYAAATPVSRRVEKAMRPFSRFVFGNPSSVHAEGRAARAAVDAARRDVAEALGAHTDEIIFTNGVTEAINIALLGVLGAAEGKQHVVTVATEHAATLRTLVRPGIDVTVVPVGEDGVPRVEDILAAIRPNTALVSVMYANNEIGTIAPIAEIGRAIEKLRRTTKSAYPVFHTDAAQAAQYLDVDVTRLHVDLVSLSGQKMYGPKGTGALFVRRGVAVTPFMFGGSQEHGLRPGTENVAGIVGFAQALTDAVALRDAESIRVAALREAFFDMLLTLPGVRVNGSRIDRLPNNVNVSFEGVDGEALVMYLDKHGIAASTASSCTGPQSMSHVLRALGLSDTGVVGSVRFTLGRSTTYKDIKMTISVIKTIFTLLKP